MNKEQYFKIENPEEKADMAIALFREFKRKQDWEFCWQLFRDWFVVICPEKHDALKRETWFPFLQWLDENWVGNQIGGILRKNFLQRGFPTLVFGKTSKLYENNHKGWSFGMLDNYYALSFSFVLAGIMHLSPQGLLSPGPNFPDLITVPEEYRLKNGKDH